MSSPEHDEIKEKVDQAADKFMDVVNTASGGCGKAVLNIIHADKKDLVELHVKLASQNQSYKDAFNAYSNATNSPSGKELERKVHVASAEENAFVKISKIFAAAASHLPTYLTILHNEKKMERIFRDNYKPKI